MKLNDFWSTPNWLAYEAAYGDDPGTRARLLASAVWATRVIDLEPDVSVLWRGVRKSYHSLINRLCKDNDFMIVEPCNGSAFIEKCRPLHLREAGRETRPIATWLIQAEWIDRGFGRCFVGVRGYQEIGFAYVACYDRWSYYFSAASIEPNVQHALQWYALRALKAGGIYWYELGWQGHATNHKEESIEFFRRGWGGADRALTEDLG